MGEDEKKEEKKNKIDGPVIGIDLGTRITPSYVAFTDEERLVGEAAKNQATNNVKRSIYVVSAKPTLTAWSRRPRSSPSRTRPSRRSSRLSTSLRTTSTR